MKVNKKKLKVFHGLVNYGTQAGFFAKELRNQGVDALSVIYSDKFKRTADKELLHGGNFFQKSFRHIKNWIFKIKCIFHFDIFHFYYGKTLLPKQLDLYIYKLMNKKIVFHYLGNEVQGYKLSVEKYKWTNMQGFMGDNDPIEYDRRINKRIENETKFANMQFVCAPCYSEFVPNSIVIPLAIDLINYSHVPQPKNDIIEILHAPTHNAFKGTDYIEGAIEQLKKNGYNFKYTRIKNLTHSELKNKYKECDIFIDQIMGGWYGTAAIEAMAIGRPVICTIRKSYFKHIDFGEEIPIIHADPDCIYESIKFLLDNPEKLADIGLKSRQFVEDNHDVKKITKKLITIYNNL
jgi:glycosyltransferase involved in cell wall biosynthesis